jgi:hypothetical protein
MRGTDANPQPYIPTVRERLFERREFIAELHFQVSRFANQKEAAQAWGVSESYLSDVLSGWRAPGEKICKAVGYERVTMYRKVEA